MGFCTIADPPVYTEEIEHWTRETDADGEAMGAVIEQLANNDAYLKQGIENAENTTEAVEDHLADTENPHEVTAAQLGLGNVDNTADADKTVAVAKKVGTATVGGATTPVYINAGTPTACTAYGSATVNKANYAGVTTVGTASLKNIYAGTGSMTAGSTTLTTGNIYLQYE